MFSCYPLEACYFLMRDRKGMKPEGRGGTERRKERGNYNQDILYEKTLFK